jgi:hypothetical protein
VPERKVEIVKKKKEVSKNKFLRTLSITVDLIAGTSHKRWNQNGLQELGLWVDL